LHITSVYFLAKNWKVWCFLAKVMISRVSLSKSKVFERSGFWVSLKVKTWIDRIFWLNLYLFKFLELISRKKWPPRPEAAVPRAN
jgi:Na+/H+ antiporter NhaD/arsenite permease-like protein